MFGPSRTDLAKSTLIVRASHPELDCPSSDGYNWYGSYAKLPGTYALFPMLDGWTTVFDGPGKRTSGTEALTYAITGPGWEGKLPEGVKQY